MDECKNRQILQKAYSWCSIHLLCSLLLALVHGHGDWWNKQKYFWSCSHWIRSQTLKPEFSLLFLSDSVAHNKSACVLSHVHVCVCACVCNCQAKIQHLTNKHSAKAPLAIFVRSSKYQTLWSPDQSQSSGLLSVLFSLWSTLPTFSHTHTHTVFLCHKHTHSLSLSHTHTQKKRASTLTERERETRTNDIFSRFSCGTRRARERER